MQQLQLWRRLLLRPAGFVLLILLAVQPLHSLGDFVFGGDAGISLGFDPAYEDISRPELGRFRFSLNLSHYGGVGQLGSELHSSLTAELDAHGESRLGFEELYLQLFFSSLGDLTVGRTDWRESPAVMFPLTNPLHAADPFELLYAPDMSHVLPQDMLKLRAYHRWGYVRGVWVPTFRGNAMPRPGDPLFPSSLIPDTIQLHNEYSLHEVQIGENEDIPADGDLVYDYGFDAGLFLPWFDLRFVYFDGWERELNFSGSLKLNQDPWRTYTVILYPERSRIRTIAASAQGLAGGFDWWVEASRSWNATYGPLDFDNSNPDFRSNVFHGDRGELTLGAMYSWRMLQLGGELHRSRLYEVRFEDSVVEEDDWNIRRPLLANGLGGFADVRMFDDRLVLGVYGLYDFDEDVWGMVWQLRYEPEAYGPLQISLSHPNIAAPEDSLYREIPLYTMLQARYRW